MNLELRAPTLEEAGAMARLHIACWREVYEGIVPAAALAAADLDARTARWRNSIANPDHFALAAFEGVRPVAFVLARPNADPAIPDADGHIAALYVLKSHYRLKLGSRLMAATARWWLARGGRALGLGVLADNMRATAFYESLGGRVVKRGTYLWDDRHPLADAIFVFDNLAELADRT